MIKKVAAAFAISPDYFLEAQLAEVQLQFDGREVGWAQATKNLEIWRRVSQIAETSTDDFEAHPAARDSTNYGTEAGSSPAESNLSSSARR